jgi:cobalt-zinc-cadmium efflux system protein
VLPRGWILLRDTTHILLEGTPRGLSVETVRSAIAAVPGVNAVHDLHLWSLSSDDTNASVHAVLAKGADHDEVRKRVAEVLEEAFGVHHATVQTEAEPCGDADELHP